ncbi:MAG: zinc ribbon domain-containing protein [Gemmatimonadota bacterium]|nr:zinc ribbon domain-containing protein [Gemmatimonadota bacterium]
MEDRAASLFDLLRRRLAEEAMPDGAALAVAELHRRLVPYALCRETLELATKAEYDLALLRLLADEDRIAVAEPGLREAVRRELESPEPGLGLLHRFAASEIRPASGVPASAGPPPADHETERRATDRVPGLDALEERPAAPDVPAPPAARVPGAAAAPATGPACRACRAPLPDVEELRYCTACGADQARWPCRGCGAEVERGWRYCPRCGIVQDSE